MEPMELLLTRTHVADLRRDAERARLAASAPRPTRVPLRMSAQALGERLSATVAALVPAARTTTGAEVCCA